MVMTMLSSSSGGWGNCNWEWNGIYIRNWSSWDELNFQKVAAQLSMNKFTTPAILVGGSSSLSWSQSPLFLSMHDHRIAHCSPIAQNFCCSIMLALYLWFVRFRFGLSLSPLPLTTSIFSFVLPEFFSFFFVFLSVFAVEINDVNGRKI